MKYYSPQLKNYKLIYVVRCTIWYHLYNLKNVKNTHGEVLVLVKLQAKGEGEIFRTHFKHEK